MKLKIRYSHRAKAEEIELLEYVINRFGQQKGQEVFFRIEKILDQISKMPKMYPASNNKKGLRKCVFSKQSSIYYRIEKEYIEVISFRVNRKDPDSY